MTTLKQHVKTVVGMIRSGLHDRADRYVDSLAPDLQETVWSHVHDYDLDSYEYVSDRNYDAPDRMLRPGP